MLKVIFINRVMSMFHGGGETYTLNIARGLKELGCDVQFIVTRPWFGKVRYPIQEFDTEYVASPYLRDISHLLFAIGNNSELIPHKSVRFYFYKIIHYIGSLIYRFDDSKSQRDIFSHLSKRVNNTDLIQVFGHSGLACRIKKELNKPVVIRFPGPPGKNRNEQILACDAVIANGHAFKDIKENITGKVVNIPTGIDSGKFKPVNTDVRNNYGIEDDEKLVLFTGRFIHFKNLPFLVKGMAEVIKQNDKVKLMLVGEGPFFGQIKKMVSVLKIENKVVFTGKIPNDVLPRYYSAADLYLITSNYDNFPNAVIEAMACGLPVVATNVGGIPDLVENGVNGFCIENNNIAELKETVLKMLKDDKLSDEIGNNNRETVGKRFNWLKSAGQFLEVYEDVLAKK